MSSFDIAIIGIGRLGCALGLAFEKSGYRIKQLLTNNIAKTSLLATNFNQTPEILTISEVDKLTADIIFITTQDSEISAIGAVLATELTQLPFVYHTSGALSSNILQPLREENFNVASFHPLVSISDPIDGANSFEGTSFCLEGDELAVDFAKQLVRRLGGRHFCIEAQNKALYHAAAVMACGNLVALLSTSIEMLGKCGIGESEARQILVPLIDSTIDNFKNQKAPQALTGPFARGDFETMINHIEAIKRDFPPDVLAVYSNLGIKSLDLAKTRGLPEDVCAEMISILKKI